MMVDWAGPEADEQVGPAKGDREDSLWGLREGELCVYVCARTHSHACVSGTVLSA